MSNDNTNKNRGRSANRARVLGDHRQQGKRFVPPILQYMNLEEIDWKYDVLPELVWIGLLIAKFGIKTGVELCVGLGKAAAACVTESTSAFAFVSDYAQLQQAEQECVVGRLRELGQLERLVGPLDVLATHYPQCPLAFLRSGTQAEGSDVEGINTLKTVIREMSNRRDKAATWTQATAIYMHFIIGNLKVPPNSGLSDFTAIENYPETEASKKVAASVRALVNGLTAHVNRNKGWPNYFWNRGRSLESCERDDPT